MTENIANPFGGMITDTVEETAPEMAAPLAQSQKVIASLSPAAFDQMTKILVMLQDQGMISIVGGIICQAVNKGTTILKCDITGIVGDLNLHISNPKKYVKLFKSIKGNKNVQIIDDEEQQRYIVLGEEVKLFLPKQLDSVIESMSPPDLSKAQLLSSNPSAPSIHIPKELKDTIKSFASGSEYIDILFRGSDASAIYIPETAVINFPNVKENIDETNADLILRSYAFIIADSDEFDLFFGKLGDDYWVLTNSKNGIVQISVMENTQEVSSDNLLI